MLLSFVLRMSENQKSYFSAQAAPQDDIQDNQTVLSQSWAVIDNPDNPSTMTETEITRDNKNTTSQAEAANGTSMILFSSASELDTKKETFDVEEVSKVMKNGDENKLHESDKNSKPEPMNHESDCHGLETGNKLEYVNLKLIITCLYWRKIFC